MGWTKYTRTDGCPGEKKNARAKVQCQNNDEFAACLSKARDALNKLEFGDRDLTVIIVGDICDDSGQELGIELTDDVDYLDDDTLDSRAYALLTE